MSRLPIVWVPGHLCGAWLYAPQIEALQKRESIIADISRDDALGGMADRLLSEAPDRFVVAGLSMGGMVAMEAMARAPQRIAGAVLMDTDPRPARDKELAFRDEQRQRVVDQGLEPVVRPFAERFFGHDADISARLLDKVVERMCETPVPVYLAQSRALDGRRDMLAPLAGFSAPAAVVVGAEDVICPARLHGPLAEALNEAQLTEIPGTGHLSTLERPEAVTAAIEALLARVEHTGAPP